jgi:hypothetical protein
VRFLAISLTPLNSPFSAFINWPLSIANTGPLGSMFAEAFPSNQLMAPQLEYLCGVMMQTWVGANDWHKVQP